MRTARSLSDSTISGNMADEGGGIDNGGMLFITNSTIAGNRAHGDGGGIYNLIGTATISKSTIADNVAESETFMVAGGGIKNTGALVMDNSTISGNKVVGSEGGRIDNDAFPGLHPGTFAIAYCTISENTADRGGGHQWRCRDSLCHPHQPQQ